MRTGEHLTPQEVRVLVKSDSEKTFARGMFGLVAAVGPTAAVVSLVVAVALACFVRFFLEEDVDLCELSLVSVRTRVLLRFDMLVVRIIWSNSSSAQIENLNFVRKVEM